MIKPATLSDLYNAFIKSDDDVALDAGGLERKLIVSRLPNAGFAKEMTFARNKEIKENGDNSIWICVFIEDGFQV